jgi:hypothetical protein
MKRYVYLVMLTRMLTLIGNAASRSSYQHRLRWRGPCLVLAMCSLHLLLQLVSEELAVTLCRELD